MFRYKEFLKESSKPVDEYKVIQTTGLSGGQKSKDKYQVIKTSGLSGGQKPKKTPIKINPIKEDFSSQVKPPIHVEKHPPSPEDKFTSDLTYYNKSEFKKRAKENTHGYEPFEHKHYEDHDSYAYEKPDDENYNHVKNIKDYTEWSRNLNDYLHKKDQGLASDDDSAYYEDRANKLSNTITKQPAKKDLYVYSGLKGDPSDQKKQHGVKDYFKDNQVIKARLPAFTSTSMEPEVARQFVEKHYDSDKDEFHSHFLKIKIPEGSRHGMYVGHHSSVSHENEFILDKNKRLHIHPEPEIHTIEQDKRDPEMGNYYKVKHKQHIWHAHIVEDDK